MLDQNNILRQLASTTKSWLAKYGENHGGINLDDPDSIER